MARVVDSDAECKAQIYSHDVIKGYPPVLGDCNRVDVDKNDDKAHD